MKQSRLLILSNLVFLVPFLFSLHVHLYLHATTISIVFLVSSWHHLTHNQILERLDIFLAYTLIGFNIVLVTLGKFSLPYFPIVVILVVIAISLFFHKKRATYAPYHILWHISSALITIFSAATYLSR